MQIAQLYGQVYTDISATTIAASSIGRQNAQLRNIVIGANSPSSSPLSQSVAASASNSDDTAFMSGDGDNDSAGLFSGPAGEHGIQPVDTGENILWKSRVL